MSHDQSGIISRIPDPLGEELNRRQGKRILPQHCSAAIDSFKMVERPPSPVSSPPGEDIPWLARQPSNVPTSFPALSLSNFRILRLLCSHTAEGGAVAAIQSQPNSHQIVLNRVKSRLIAFGARPSRPSTLPSSTDGQQRDFVPRHRSFGPSVTSRRRFPLRRPLQPNRAKSYLIVLNPWPSGRTDAARRIEMLRVVAPYVAEMLHLNLLTINVVAGVAGF